MHGEDSYRVIERKCENKKAWKGGTIDQGAGWMKRRADMREVEAFTDLLHHNYVTIQYGYITCNQIVLFGNLHMFALI